MNMNLLHFECQRYVKTSKCQKIIKEVQEKLTNRVVDKKNDTKECDLYQKFLKFIIAICFCNKEISHRPAE